MDGIPLWGLAGDWGSSSLLRALLLLMLGLAFLGLAPIPSQSRSNRDLISLANVSQPPNYLVHLDLVPACAGASSDPT